MQPANRSKIGKFDDAAPVWRFKGRLGAMEDPEASRRAVAGFFLIEVFPALALPSLAPAFCGRLLGPRDDPARRKAFAPAGWHAVIATVGRVADQEDIGGLREWADASAAIPAPKKADQDRLDAVLCALIGLHWHSAPRDAAIMPGDRISGYRIAPASPDVRARLVMAAEKAGVPVDIDVPGRPMPAEPTIAPRQPHGVDDSPVTHRTFIRSVSRPICAGVNALHAWATSNQALRGSHACSHLH